MKTNYLLLMTATLICVSCTRNEFTDSSEMRIAYLQTHGESQDSTGTGSKDSTYVFRSNSKGIAKNDSIAEDSTRCDLFIDGKLIVDGGTSSDISNTFVTVEKITVNVWADDRKMETYYPVAHTDVAEPSEVLGWENMPTGIKYSRKRLNMEPLTMSYKDSFYAEVTVCYILRVRDTKLAEGCTVDRYWNTVRCETSRYRENRIEILVPLELTTIQFNATVDSYD